MPGRCLSVRARGATPQLDEGTCGHPAANSGSDSGPAVPPEPVSTPPTGMDPTAVPLSVLRLAGAVAS